MTNAKYSMCGHDKDAENFLMQCPSFLSQPVRLFLRATPVFHPLSYKTLLFGKTTYNNEQNLYILTAVQQYVKETKRFNSS